MPHLVVIGSTNIDLTFRVAQLPRPGETVAGLGLLTGHGGKGANQAVMAARLGARVSMISALGADAFGQQALANYRDNGIDTAFVRVSAGQPTGTAAIVVDASANNTIIVVPGANGAVSPDDARAAAERICSANAVLAQLETPTDATTEAFRIARAAGVRTILNPAPARVLTGELLALTDLCIPNETELETLTGRSVRSPDEVADAARALRDQGPGQVLVTLGAAGAFLLDGGNVASPRVEAVDPTAAGDAFIGALGVHLASGMSLIDAARRACAVAALTVTRPGAQGSFPPRAEIDAWLAAQVG
jgi:ribokinase